MERRHASLPRYPAAAARDNRISTARAVAPSNRAGYERRGHRGSAHACRSSSWSRRCGRAAPGWCGCRTRPRGDGSRTSAAVYPHTAHESSALQICYRHHPFFGSEVDLVRTLRRNHADVVVVSLPDQVQIAVPRWMLDPRACDQLPAEDCARIGLPALRSLRTLLNSQPLSVTGSREDSCATRIPGGIDAQTETEASPPASVALSGRSSGGAALRGGAPPLPAASRPAAADRSSDREIAPEGR